MVNVSEMAGRLARVTWRGENGATLLSQELQSMLLSFANGNPVVLDTPLVLRQSGAQPALTIVRTGPDPAWQPTQLVDQPPGGYYGPMPTFTPAPYTFNNSPSYPAGFSPAGPSYYGGGTSTYNFGGGDTTITVPGLPPGVVPPTAGLPPLGEPGQYTPSTPLFGPDGGPVGPPLGTGGGGGGSLIGIVLSGSGGAYKVAAYLDTSKDIDESDPTTIDVICKGVDAADRIDSGAWVTISKYGAKYYITPGTIQSGV